MGDPITHRTSQEAAQSVTRQARHTHPGELSTLRLLSRARGGVSHLRKAATYRRIGDKKGDSTMSMKFAQKLAKEIGGKVIVTTSHRQVDIARRMYPKYFWIHSGTNKHKLIVVK